MNGLLCVGALQSPHVFCKGETDNVFSIENHAIRLLNQESDAFGRLKRSGQLWQKSAVKKDARW
jgi:hypothetical protein